MKVKSLSRVQLFVTPWTVAYEAPPSMGFSMQEYWSGLPFPSPGHGFMNPPVNVEAHILLALPKMYMITSTQFRNPKDISCLFLFFTQRKYHKFLNDKGLHFICVLQNEFILFTMHYPISKKYCANP